MGTLRAYHMLKISTELRKITLSLKADPTTNFYQDSNRRRFLSFESQSVLKRHFFFYWPVPRLQDLKIGPKLTKLQNELPRRERQKKTLKDKIVASENVAVFDPRAFRRFTTTSALFPNSGLRRRWRIYCQESSHLETVFANDSSERRGRKFDVWASTRLRFFSEFGDREFFRQRNRHRSWSEKFFFSQEPILED